jgi:alpha-tubulin suppressor-like RCC1 family protein
MKLNTITLRNLSRILFPPILFFLLLSAFTLSGCSNGGSGSTSGISPSPSLIAVGGYHTLEIKKDGTLYAWGYNRYGQLGDGTTVDKKSPVQIGTNSNWASVSAGEYFSTGLTKDGSIYIWGCSKYKSLGDCSEESNHIPVRMGTDSDWAAVSAGADHIVALKTDGSLYAWGNNGNGELGYETSYATQKTPGRVGTASDWAMISAGERFTMAIKRDGSLYGCGYNGMGQLGIGTTIDSVTPVRIGADSDLLA